MYGMYLRGVWDYRRNRRCQDGRLEVYVKGNKSVRNRHKYDLIPYRFIEIVGDKSGIWASGPNIRNSCPERRKADVSDVLGFVSCQTCPESCFVVMLSCESFFRKLLKMRRQLDLMADIIHWRTWRERERQASSLLFPSGCSLRLKILALPLVVFRQCVIRYHFHPHFFETMHLDLVERMAENLQGDQPAEGVVQIPRELPFIYRWVTNDVLGTSSALDQQYLDELKLTELLFGGGTWSGGTGWKLPAVGSGCASLTSITQPSLIGCG
ncbi:hypothetical protein PIB30_092922 [Stylosanthes scabra]|uniref:Uncharacterized protein n=1 Tax=Stylosanthes scabra TaxID=79078 RepID=A0ABU6RVD3_9FABA|nr:hypothetical protein [Stylosanthes scabra]